MKRSNRLLGLAAMSLLVALSACSKDDEDKDKEETATVAVTVKAASDGPGVAATVKVGDRTVEAGDVKVKQGPDGTEVQAGDETVKVGPGGVEAGGVKVGKDGTVKVPGVSVP